MGTLVADLRYAWRMLRKNPSFTAVAVLTLALGIGANTAIFTAVNAVLFQPLSYPQASRIVMIWDIYRGARSEVTFHTYRELAERNHSFSQIAAMDVWQPTLTGPFEPERLDGQLVSASYFRALGVRPAAGRGFQASDDVHGRPKVVILSDALWRRRFGGDSKIAGRQVTLDGDSYTVIGVMPRGFENVLAPSAEIWSPLQYDMAHVTDFQTMEWGHHMHMVGRLRPGVSIGQATRELGTIASTPVAEFPRPPWASLRYGFIVNPLQEEVTRDVRPALLAILAAVTVVLLIACTNVANLLLARSAQRRGEWAMRSALGAPRWRLIGQMLTESLLLSAIGGALGMLLADLGVRAVAALSPAGLPRLADIAANGPVLSFALGLTTLVGLAVGLMPTLHSSRSDVPSGLQQGSRRTTGQHQATRRALVVAEVALALVLLVSAGLLLRSLGRLLAVKPGFDSSHLLTMQVQEAGHRYDQDYARRQFFAEALEAVRRVPGVRSAAFTSLLPMDCEQFAFDKYGTKFEDGNSYEVFRYAVTPGYLESMGIPLLRGRLLDEHDGAGAPPVVLISESLAKSQFAGKNPIGKRVHVGPTDRPWYVIVGVVGNVKQTSLAVSEPDAVYITEAQAWFADQAMSLVVRARGNASALAPAVRKAVWSVDKDQPILRVATMDDLLAVSAAQRRFALTLFQAFGILALALAAVGIYGVVSGSVTERTHEIGVRLALGASRDSILALVVGQGITLGGLGIAIGLAGAAAASRALRTLLFGVSPIDPTTYVGMIVLLLGVAALASYIPARRATKVDPMVALRYE